jgi:hypothetical protein
MVFSQQNRKNPCMVVWANAGRAVNLAGCRLGGVGDAH